MNAFHTAELVVAESGSLIPYRASQNILHLEIFGVRKCFSSKILNT